jgi:hypothetical protein
MPEIDNHIEDKERFNKTFGYICFTTVFVLLYILAVTFIPIPEKNQRYADIALGFLIGTVLTGGMMWLTGGSPAPIKKPTLPLPTNIEGDNNVISS